MPGFEGSSEDIAEMVRQGEAFATRVGNEFMAYAESMLASARVASSLQQQLSQSEAKGFVSHDDELKGLTSDVHDKAIHRAAIGIKAGMLMRPKYSTARPKEPEKTLIEKAKAAIDAVEDYPY